jgi:long-chain acyl-CoA synthetase
MHYGLTEASRSTFIEFHESAQRLDSIGKATAHVLVKIVDSRGQEVQVGESGEIVVRGGMVAQGYWRDPELTSRILGDGWMHTGDIGHVDDSGHIFLHGREDDMINVGGFNVAPVEVEHALDQHENIERSACIGIPDPKGIAGQVVKAFVVPAPGSNPRPTPEELLSFLRGSIEEYKIPVAWEWLDSLPETSSGKLQRNILRQRELSASGSG